MTFLSVHVVELVTVVPRFSKIIAARRPSSNKTYTEMDIFE